MEVQGMVNKEIRDIITEYLEENEHGMREAHDMVSQPGHGS